jgi:hypothetical protein
MKSLTSNEEYLRFAIVASQKSRDVVEVCGSPQFAYRLGARGKPEEQERSAYENGPVNVVDLVAGVMLASEACFISRKGAETCWEMTWCLL